tara:strand:+ start:1788 stop:2000 length:213 start_codon:yes stop_codon:yes gene_type:complete
MRQIESLDELSSYQNRTVYMKLDDKSVAWYVPVTVVQAMNPNTQYGRIAAQVTDGRTTATKVIRNLYIDE